jgi:hypothetical protein
MAKSHNKMLSREDQRTFDRWLNDNVIVGFILAVGLVAMAVVASSSGSQHDAMATDRTKAAIAAPGKGSRQMGGSSSGELAARGLPF